MNRVENQTPIQRKGRQPMLKQREELLGFALQLAKAAADQIMPRYQNCVVNTKPDGTQVTEADRRAEEAVREMITRHFPDANILGEEFGATDGPKTRYRWVIDPLDGTTWFTLGVPIFGTLIALLEDEEPRIGVIHFPVTGETIYAGKGLGCWFRGGDAAAVQVHVASKVGLKEAVVSAAGIHSSNILTNSGERPYNLTGLIHRVNRFRFCGDCLQHALVCRGRIHAAVDTLMQPWDSAAIIPCIEEAGGVATTLSGQREGIVFGGNLVTSCDTSLHHEILKLLQPSEDRPALLRPRRIP
jgi:histidinol-phosphatase